MKSRLIDNRIQLALSPIIVCFFLLTGLFTYLLLQGNLQDWRSFMGGEASMALIGLYSIASVAGLIAALFKKEASIFKATRKTLTITFLITLLIGFGVFTYLNFRHRSQL